MWRCYYINYSISVLLMTDVTYAWLSLVSLKSEGKWVAVALKARLKSGYKFTLALMESWMKLNILFDCK